MRASIFVTDDDEVVRSSITRRLSRGQHDIRSFDSGEALLEGLNNDIPDILLLDLKMPGMTGLETLKHVRSKAPQTLVILLTAYGTIEDAVEAMRLGAYDFLIKSIDLSGVGPVVERAIAYLTLRRRVSFETQGSAGRYALKDLIANSPSMRGATGAQPRDTDAQRRGSGGFSYLCEHPSSAYERRPAGDGHCDDLPGT